MIVFEDGRTAQLIGAFIVFGVGDAIPIEECRPRPITQSIAVPLDGIAAPIMFALLDLPRGDVKAALSLRDYNIIAIANTKPTSVPPQISAPARFVQNIAARTQQRFGGCCGQKGTG